MPSWALTLTYTLHLLATVVLVGGLFTLAVLVFPAVLQHPTAPGALALPRLLRRRFQPLAWLSLAILAATGMLQMTSHPAYAGVLVIRTPWSAALLAKHAAFALLLAASAYQTWFLWPMLERAALRHPAGDAHPEAPRLVAQQQRWIRISFGLGVAILVLTAVAQTL